MTATTIIGPSRHDEKRLSSLLPRTPDPEKQPAVWRSAALIAMGEPKAVQRAANAIDSSFPDVEPSLKKEDRERLVRELARRQQAHDWSGYNWADLQRAARALLEPGHEDSRAAAGRRKAMFGRAPGGALHQRREFKPLVRFLLDQVHGQTNTRFLRTMWRLYLSTFDSRSRLTRDLADRLQGCCREAALPIQGAVRLGVLKPGSAVRRIADHVMTAPSPFEAVKEVGIEAPHGEGLMAEVHKEFVRRHSAALIRNDEVASDRLLDWIVPPESPESPAMEAGAELGINALLVPWARAEPSQEIRKRLVTTLTRAFGDPRISRSGVWNRCNRDARKVLMRWLAGETIDVFFEIISKAVSSHMWGDRRGLWMDMYRDGSIKEAWFALSPRGEDVARRLERTPGYARNDSRNSGDKQKCLLLMRINGRLVVEGSHSFKTHIYGRGDNGSVTLYETAYDCDHIRQHGKFGRAEAIAHYRNWRRRVLDALSE